VRSDEKKQEFSQGATTYGSGSPIAQADHAAVIHAVSTANSTNSPNFQGLSMSANNAANPAYYTGNTVVNNYFSPVSNSVTREAFESLEAAVTNATNQIVLTAHQVQLLAQALHDLDQRTSGIQKLPDGRTQFGQLITGIPTVVVDALNAGWKSYTNQDFHTALKYLEQGIDAMEATNPQNVSMETGRDPAFNGGLYALAAICQQKLGSNVNANAYAEKAIKTDPSPRNKVLYATTLTTLGVQSLTTNDFKKALDFCSLAAATYESVTTEATNAFTQAGVLAMYGAAAYSANELGKTNEFVKFSMAFNAHGGSFVVPQK